jgi:hypothetical protein
MRKNWLFIVDGHIIKLKPERRISWQGGYHGGDESAGLVF